MVNHPNRNRHRFAMLEVCRYIRDTRPSRPTWDALCAQFSAQLCHEVYTAGLIARVLRYPAPTTVDLTAYGRTILTRPETGS